MDGGLEDYESWFYPKYSFFLTPTQNRVNSEHSVNWILGRFCEGWVAGGAMQRTRQHLSMEFPPTDFQHFTTNFLNNIPKKLAIKDITFLAVHLPLQAFFVKLESWQLSISDKQTLKVSCLSKFLWSAAVSRVLMIHIVANNGVTMVFCEQASRLWGGTIVANSTKQQHNHRYI